MDHQEEIEELQAERDRLKNEGDKMIIEGKKLVEQSRAKNAKIPSIQQKIQVLKTYKKGVARTVRENQGIHKRKLVRKERTEGVY